MGHIPSAILPVVGLQGVEISSSRLMLQPKSMSNRSSIYDLKQPSNEKEIKIGPIAEDESKQASKEITDVVT